ncbi:XRE family transcriptional regulator [Silvibacterium sp.]|uniref:XRE family transcriptional regulator n=1 Tax=Silvibacterium sp. TaxID=1964179 RepID=UPI0039E3E415
MAEEWGNDAYQISGSWLARLERGRHEMTVPKLISLATIYSESPERLLRDAHPDPKRLSSDSRFLPNMTVLVSGGQLDAQAHQMLPDGMEASPIPEATTLLPADGTLSSNHHRRAIIGKRDLSLSPAIKPGSIVSVDTRSKAIAGRQSWNHEFDRPIYLLLTHDGYVCGWCDLDESGTWLTLVTHALSKQPFQRWRYRKDVEVVGRVVAVAIRLVS